MNDTAPVTQQVGQRTEQLGVVVTQRGGEMAANAMAAKQKSLIEARYVIAYNRPRSILQARSDILAACQRPGFAQSARYKKPVGNTTIDGFSIRFAEEAIKAMKNISVESSTIYEDENKRTVQITVTDLESNVTYGKEITVEKTVERKKLKDGQTPISKRTNSVGETTYLVAATEDDIANKVASAESKIIRNCGLRLVPSDILEEAEEAIAVTLEHGGEDPKEATKKVVDAFASLNIGAVELEKYLKHGLATISPKEIASLRAIFAAVKDGEASWADYITEDGAAKTKPNLGPKKEEPKAEEPLQTVSQPSALEPEDEKPKEKKAKAKAAPVEDPVQTSDDGDLGPQIPNGIAITPELAAKLGELKIPLTGEKSFETWLNKSGYIAEMKADSAKACQKLLESPRTLTKIQTMHGS